MIRYSNSLLLKRLVILKSGGALYDQRFHEGVNIIRGENSSGKSTIADFIFYVFGGDVAAWTPQAGAADSVHGEVAIGGRTYTLSRDVASNSRQPISFFEGAYDDAMSQRALWLRYPEKRSINTDSYSQVLFRLLNFPEQKTQAQQNITMHQVLRLLYCDQMTPVDRIFREEKYYDTKDIRVAISELLLGIDDLAMHETRTEIRSAEKSFSEIEGELRSLFAILGKTSDSDITVNDIMAEMEGVRRELAEKRTEVNDLSQKRDQRKISGADEKMSALSAELREVNNQIASTLDAMRTLTFDIEDSKKFIETIDLRIDALDASLGMAAVLGDVSFRMCPACFTPIADSAAEGACHLCKSPLHVGDKRGGHLKMREELAFQEKESRTLLEEKIRRLNVLNRRSTELQMVAKSLRSQISEFRHRVDPLDAEIGNLMQRIGYLEKSVEDLHRKSALAEIVSGKIERRNELNTKISSLNDYLALSENSRRARSEKVATRINELCTDALRRDLPQEEEFQNAELVEYDFGKNNITVNGRSKFSASSATYLKNSFLFSLFELSLEDPEVRWPRFILLDNIEDKGMQPKRSANFQEYVVAKTAESKVEHQVILTTSMISENLENSPYCVGPHYSENNKTLAFSSGVPRA